MQISDYEWGILGLNVRVIYLVHNCTAKNPLFEMGEGPMPAFCDKCTCSVCIWGFWDMLYRVVVLVYIQTLYFFQNWPIVAQMLFGH